MAYTVRMGRVWLTEMGSPGTGPDPTAMSRVDVVAAGKGGAVRESAVFPPRHGPPRCACRWRAIGGWGPVSRAEP